MLDLVRIKNFVLIEEAEIPFQSGLNMISGETGAGKSILIEAISLLLGSRASTESVRMGAEEARVEGLFSIERCPWIQERLTRFELQNEEDPHSLLIQRVVSRSGKHRTLVNGRLTTLTNLQTIGEGLVDLCGQHEHQSLLKPSVQIQLLDQYGGLTALQIEFATLLKKVRKLDSELRSLLLSEESRARQVAFLEFQRQELERAQLRVHEDQELTELKTKAQSVETRTRILTEIQSLLLGESEGGSGAISDCQSLLQKIKDLSRYDQNPTETWKPSVETALGLLQDVSLEVERYRDRIQGDETDLESIQERLSLIADLKRKYGSTIEDILGNYQKIQTELRLLCEGNERIESLQIELAEFMKSQETIARSLRKKRKAASHLLAETVTGELQELKMAGSIFTIDLQPLEHPEHWTEWGADQIQFLIRTNVGNATKPLAKIASGGELSRVMLAIRRTIAGQSGVGVYLFDEIDSGMGGQTAFTVGKKLKSVSQYHQVICITHVPQIAAFSDHHLRVEKVENKGEVRTLIRPLTSKEKREELARMLGGDQLTKKALENASELLVQAQSI